MRRIPARDIVWSLRRYTRNKNLWDRVCFLCKQTTPTFEYEHHDKQERPLYSYLCDECAQKKLTKWLHHIESPESAHLDFQADFDIATVFYEQKNDGETLLLTRWSTEQRQRRLGGNRE